MSQPPARKARGLFSPVHLSNLMAPPPTQPPVRDDRMSSYLADAARVAGPSAGRNAAPAGNQVPRSHENMYSIRRQQQLDHGRELKIQAQAQQRHREDQRCLAVNERRAAQQAQPAYWSSAAAAPFGTDANLGRSSYYHTADEVVEKMGVVKGRGAFSPQAKAAHQLAGLGPMRSAEAAVDVAGALSDRRDTLRVHSVHSGSSRRRHV